MGIVEEDNSIDINAFGDLLSEISDSLKEQSIFLKENSEKKVKTQPIKKFPYPMKRYSIYLLGKE